MLVFVQRVRGEAALERDVDAEVLARATVRALGARMSADASTGLTAGLPEELVVELDAHSAGNQAEFDRSAFLDRVAAELGGTDDRDTLEARVHAVLAVVREWAPAGRLEDTLARLPSSLAAMFARRPNAEPYGPTRTTARRRCRWCCPTSPTSRAC